MGSVSYAKRPPWVAGGRGDFLYRLRKWLVEALD
jgi:hypothetical protein